MHFAISRWATNTMSLNIQPAATRFKYCKGEFTALTSQTRATTYTQGSSRIAKWMDGNLEAAAVPCGQPRCCGGSWLLVNPVRSPARQQTAWRWPRRSQHCRCSLPRANRDPLGRNKEEEVLGLKHLCRVIEKREVMHTLCVFL